MSIALAVLTDRSCGEACWHAREDVCRCECGGSNHGILLKDGTEQPNRHSRIDGVAYELVAIGEYRELCQKASQICEEAPEYPTRDYYDSSKMVMKKHNFNHGTWLVQLKPASKAQCVLWNELSAYKGLSNFEFYQRKPYLLWQIIK